MSRRNVSYYIKKIVSIGAIIILLILIKNTGSSILSTASHSNSLNSLKEKLYNKKQENVYLTEKLAIAKTDEYIEEEARSKLGLIKEGEQLVIEKRLQEKEVGVGEKIPNWQKWLAFFIK